MNLTNLYHESSAYKSRKRVGRGPGSGNGKWSGRGQGGQNSRSGIDTPLGFEGGQTPLYRRLPRRGFTNARYKVTYVPVNLSSLNRFEDGQVIDEATLKEAKLIRQELNGGVKVLAKGKLEKKLTLKVNKISKSAQEQVEKLGGTIELI